MSEQPSISYDDDDDDDDDIRDDLNHLYEQYYHQILEELPAGWIRNPNVGREKGQQAPFVHPSTGKVSWKNPNQTKIKQFMKHMQKLKQRQQDQEHPDEKDVIVIGSSGHSTTSNDSIASSKSQTTMVKKLRLMLQAGAPLVAVERRAAVENIDMSLVLSNNDDDDDDDDDRDDRSSSCSSSADKHADVVIKISPILIKKYRRMIKAGVSMQQVEQLAFIEANLSPQQLQQGLAKLEAKLNSEIGNEENYNNASGLPGCFDKVMSKYLRMEKAGLPHAAILQSAKVHNDIDLVVLEMTLKKNKNTDTNQYTTNADTIKENKTVNVEDKDEEAIQSPKTTNKVEKALTEDTNKAERHDYFTKIGLNKLSFDVNTHLASLVRKMAHTVDKVNRHKADASTTMVVEMSTLYNALGSFQGVQMSRDHYNETCDRSRSDKGLAWIKLKRQGFVEIAASIGMKLPKEFDTLVEIDGLDDLIDHIEKQYRDELNDLQSLLEEGFYTYDSLGVMYKPGSRVIAKNAGGGGVDMICLVAWNRYSEGKTIMGKTTKYFNLSLQFVVAVGSHHATIAEVPHGIEQFDGKRSLLGGLLEYIPWLAYTAKQQDSLLRQKTYRGKLYNDVALNANGNGKSYSYKSYQKGSFFLKQGGADSSGVGNSSSALANSGRIIVDTQAAVEYGHSLSIGNDDFVTAIKMKIKEYKLFIRYSQNDKSRNGKAHIVSENSDDDHGMILFDFIPEEYLEMVWPYVIGFSLTAKAWGDCLVDGLDDIDFNSDVFDRLVLPNSRKRLVKALVKNAAKGNADTSHQFQDLVAGKGEGLLFLLYGPPGVGKTLTAEAVSEFLKIPLFSVSMGTLGTTADQLEKRLGEILKLSAKWNAIILLDEADAFLETRSSSSPLERNAMVAVMLRLVEYFPGILFLTSNRIESLDPAFQTRITLSLPYYDLDVESRMKVWENLLFKSGIQRDSTSDIDTKALATSSNLNGREIKNALRLALSLAAEENSPLSQELLLETASMVKPTSSKVEKEKNCFSLLSWFE